MSKGKVIVGVVVLLAAAYVAAAPYITVYQMKTAAENRDGEALSEHIEFPSLRQSLKDQMKAMFIKMAKEAEDNPFAVLGAPFAGLMAGVMIDKMVDAYVTPAGITELMRGKKPDTESGGEGSSGSSSQEPFSNASLSYESLSKFVITVKNDSGEEWKFVLRRRGIGWKLTEIILPLER